MNSFLPIWAWYVPTDCSGINPLFRKCAVEKIIFLANNQWNRRADIFGIFIIFFNKIFRTYLPCIYLSKMPNAVSASNLVLYISIKLFKFKIFNINVCVYPDITGDCMKWNKKFKIKISNNRLNFKRKKKMFKNPNCTQTYDIIISFSTWKSNKELPPS